MRNCLGILRVPLSLTLLSWVLASCGSNPMAAASQKLGVGVFAFPPSKPPVLSVAPGNAAISLSWNEVDTATQYKIFRSTTSGAFNYDQPIAKISTHLWSDLTATNGTPFFYEVRAGNNAGDTESSNEVNAQAISSFSISSANMSGSRLTFSFSSATGAETYTVKYGISSRNYTSTASTNATSPFVLNGLTAGNTYFIRVSAVNSVGSGNSIDNDRELVVRPIGAFAFSGSSATSKSITVNWASAVGASAYSLRYGTVSGSYPNILAATSATSAKVTGLDPGNPYYFSVEATNTLLGSTPVTSELSVSTAPPPQTPTGLTASGKTSSIDLEWNSAIGASAYTVYRSVSSGSGYAPVPECTGILVTTCTDTTVVNGVAYYYVVQSSDVELVSSFSSEASARAFSPFTMSSALVSNTAGPNAIALAWQAAAGAEGYTITWGTGGSSSGA
ncbi:MAG: hypothetical protein EBX52_03625, partial [Proteobacteria bacterium]|nr:hypothetical protein [Pseudomonadota bacterium]